MRMCARLYTSPPVLPPPAPVAVHSIMHHTPLSDYSVSGPARMTTREVSSLPAAHLIRSAPSPPSRPACTAPRVLITTVALIWVGGSDDGEEEGAAAATCLSKREARTSLSVCTSDPRAAGHDRPLLIPGC
ncbi:uncharacterized protein LOC113003950 [Solenopsis invicta]|uniref:uncharacterized protein LOC113003950 n=1 Tax=Solenopsis invicta TaxID=13686 RepID=UPI00193DEAFE|nr:uncharacterized protein LOC113003950 [Solenopsis invicta]